MIPGLILLIGTLFCIGSLLRLNELISFLLIIQYTKEKEANLIPKKNSCDSCIGEADLEKLSTLTKPVQKTVPVGKHCKPAKYCHNEIHYDELENDAVGLNDLQNKEHDTVDVNDTNSELEQAKQPMFEMKTKQKPEVTKLDYRPSGKTRFWGTSDICNRSSSPEVRQKAKTKSASMQGGTARQVSIPSVCVCVRPKKHSSYMYTFVGIL